MISHKSTVRFLIFLLVSALVAGIPPASADRRRRASSSHDYGDALTKCIMFFEGQRSGRLPPNQRLTWRRDSALRDGSDIGMDLVGGYYDAGDNVKFHLPMAWTTTMVGWSVLEFGNRMGRSDLRHSLDALRWGTDYFLKATRVPGRVVAQVADPVLDHDCWERPEDMDTPRNSYVLNASHPGSEVAGEIAAALTVFEFGDKHRGSYAQSVGAGACPFYCSPNGYMDELAWAAAWLFMATGDRKYAYYVKSNLGTGSTAFNWDSKFAGVYVLLASLDYAYAANADNLVCAIMPESPSKTYTYTPGGLLYSKGASSNMQNPTALCFLLAAYTRVLRARNRAVRCGNVNIDPSRLDRFVKSQADYILGSNPLGMSYMVGYGPRYPRRIHHRGSVLPNIRQHPNKIGCSEGYWYFKNLRSNPNVLTGAVVGGPDMNDGFQDSQLVVSQSEPTTYINAPFVGVLAFVKGGFKV
ncbi:unnamed protein product [Linum tenue]|uniref:Endoglucanase n=1 Tax=Linum tenue TaxID=586396 RepID=A0AAV0J517_9ROSI|nr:unnamed protein product [Linum tenue]